jgi:hypothetical protein
VKGISLGTYDFGSGPVAIGNADTIIRRLAPTVGVTPPGSATPIPVQMVALQLQSSTPINFGGFGLDNYFVTLQSAHGGSASNGQMTITFDGTGDAGTFSSFFDVFYDIRKGGLGGPVVGSGDQLFSGPDEPWNRTPPPAVPTIDTVNHRLNGVDTSQDFWPSLLVLQGGDSRLVELNATVPLPSALASGLGFAGMVVGLGFVRSISRRCVGRRSQETMAA